MPPVASFVDVTGLLIGEVAMQLVFKDVLHGVLTPWLMSLVLYYVVYTVCVIQGTVWNMDGYLHVYDDYC